METPLNLTILYTSNIRGDIHMLPRLYTFIQTLKPYQRQGTLILDLGRSCDSDVWHCGITRGRSTLIVLDGMGYHGANVDGVLDPISRTKVDEVVTMGLVDRAHPWTYHIPPVTDNSLVVGIQPVVDETLRLQIDLTPDQQTTIQHGVLRLADVNARQVGVVTIDLDGMAEITSTTVHDLPPNTPPNPTIVASVEFVESEARYFQKKQN